GPLMVSLDRLSALFLFVAGVVVLASSIFSASYLKRYSGHYSLKALNAWYLLLFAAIVLILIANDLLTFLLAWELMSILSYLLVTFEYERAETSRAGYLMLAMSEVGFVAVALTLLLLGMNAKSLEFPALKSAGIGLGAGARWILFLLTFFGFGIKAGLVPLNTWLPRAHPAAPANVSAILSGVILNLGLYGIIRVNLDLVPVNMIGAGVVMLIVGTISALVGMLYATIENDLKAILAHRSIENIGIVTVGLGAGLIFANYGKPALAGIAFIAAFYHMINHSVYKALLFLGAGTLDDRAGTRDLNELGGLIRRMPWTAACFLDRVGSRRLRTVTLPHHRTCRFQHPAVEPRSSLSVVGTRRLSLACPRSGGGGCTTGPFFVGWIVIAVIASARLACLFGLSFASFFFSSALWFFGPSLLAPSERLFTTIASADSSKALAPEVSPSKVSALSERAVWLYLMRLGGSWTSPVPSQLVARIRPLCQFVFLRSLLCLALL